MFFSRSSFTVGRRLNYKCQDKKLVSSDLTLHMADVKSAGLSYTTIIISGDNGDDDDDK